MAPRGNKGHFHGEPLSLLNDSLPLYLSIAPNKKEGVLVKILSGMGREVPETRLRELMEELKEEESLHKEETECVKAANQEETKARGRHKAVLQAYPATSVRFERAASPRCRFNSWFSNAKTKDKTRKVEPFRAWLVGLNALRGAPRHMQMPWMLWQHPTHGEVLRSRYRKAFGKDADDEEDDADELDGFEKEDGNDVDEDTPARAQDTASQAAPRGWCGEGERLVDRKNAYEKALKGETECSAEELADRRRHAEVVSQRALQSLCAQMKCKGILVLGEIVDGEEEEIFISMVQEGALPGHPDVDFPAWTPLRSKALLQAFADFLVACKKAEMGSLGKLVDPAGAPANAPGAPALCAQCMGALTPLQRPASDVPAAEPAPNAVEVSLPKVRTQRGGRRKRGRKEPEEQEAEDLGTEEEEEDELLGSGSDAERDDDLFADNDDDEDQGDQRGTPPPPPSLRYPPNTPLQKALDAMDTPQRNYRIRDLNTLSEYEFDRERNIARNKELLRALVPQDAGTAVGLPKPRPKPKASRSSTSTSAASASAEPRRSSRRLTGLDSPAPARVNTAPVAGETARDASTDTGTVETASGEMGHNVGRRRARLPPAQAPLSPPLDAGTQPAPPSLPVAVPTTGLSESSPAPPSLPCVVPTTGLGGSSPAPLPGKHPAWVAVVDVWWALEHATGFYDKTLPALPARERPGAVSWWVQRARKDRRIPAGLNTDDDSKEDFYDRVISKKLRSKKEGGGSFEELVSGLNGLTSVVACLCWWYRLARVADGTPRWTKLVEDVMWVLSEKLRACKRKRSAMPSERVRLS
ncbi:hypothetical protein B0H14DRAFT_3508248 [Mycena olivaceomarginata]|nr:hypothetical protein B0H14DRAFT_3508248 [Mycena olivaceomarginata]